jgi:hypothetical protein
MKPKDKMMDAAERYSLSEISAPRYLVTHLAWWTLGFVVH